MDLDENWELTPVNRVFDNNITEVVGGRKPLGEISFIVNLTFGQWLSIFE